MKQKKTATNDFQKNYVYYLTNKPGKNFDREFTPDLSPKQMLKLGVFGGCYMKDWGNEFPRDWFKGAKINPKEKKEKAFNFFKVLASQPWSVWKKKGWLHKDDPAGWFLWYCRYYLGRRHPDDARQIKRFKQMARHVAQLKKNCIKMDWQCRPKQRQALLHWAIDSRKL